MVKSNKIKPITSSISSTDDDDINFALCSVYANEIKQYVATNFKKEITDLDVMKYRN